jgi:hypothetical protein
VVLPGLTSLIRHKAQNSLGKAADSQGEQRYDESEPDTRRCTGDKAGETATF